MKKIKSDPNKIKPTSILKLTELKQFWKESKENKFRK